MKVKLLYCSTLFICLHACVITKSVKYKKTISPAEFDYCKFLDSFSRNDKCMYYDGALHFNADTTIYIKSLYPKRGTVHPESKDPKDILILERERYIASLRNKCLRVKVIENFRDEECIKSKNYRYCDSIETFKHLRLFVMWARTPLILDSLGITQEYIDGSDSSATKLRKYFEMRVKTLDSNTNILNCNCKFK